MRLSLETILRATGGLCVDGPSSPGLLITGVSTDSRSVPPGGLFVALPGERVDGHEYAGQAVEAGAACVLGSRNPFEGTPPVPVIVTEDPVKALGRLAHAWRREMVGKVKVAGVTGTAGKTTVKELLAHVLGGHGATARNHLNLNNQIGLPLSLLAASGDEDFWVMEAGISHAGDMDELGAILEPDLALILNVGAGHTEGLGDLGVAHCKARLLAHLAPGGQGLVSADYPDLLREARALRQDLIFFSATGQQAPYRSTWLGPAGEGRGFFRLWLDGVSLEVEAPFQGSLGAENVIAVAAAARLLGLSGEEIFRGLSTATAPRQRFAASRCGSWVIIDDSYNANPLSMTRSLEAAALRLESEQGKPALVVVLGEMLELGELAASEHRRLGQLAARLGVRALFWKGGHLDDVAAGLQEGRFSGQLFPLESAEDFLRGLQALEADGVRGGVALFKGSRRNRLEDFLPLFQNAPLCTGIMGITEPADQEPQQEGTC